MKGDVAMTIADSLSTYASAEAVGKTLHALPTDTVLHTEADLTISSVRCWMMIEVS